MSSDAVDAATREMNEGRPLAPKLRFPEFRGAEGWKLRALSELLTEPKEKNRQLKYGPEHVLSVSGEHGCVNQIEYMGRSYAGASLKEYNVVEAGDIVYTKSPLKACPNGIIKANKGPTGIVSLLYAVYRPTDHATSEFLDQYFSSDHKLNTYLQPLVKKGPKNSILVSNSDVLKGRIGVPDRKERQRIADCLSSLDAVIAAERERLAALRDYKKGLMQALFPAEGQTTPRLRFSEFRDTGEWEERPLSTCIDLVSGLHLAPDEYSDTGDIPYFSGPSDFTDVSSEIARWTSNVGNVAVQDDILLVVKGSGVGDFCRLAISRVAIGRQLMALRAVTGQQDFLFQSLALKAGLLKRRATGNLIPGLSRPDILGLRFHFPPTEGEQGRIAETLTSLDHQFAAATGRLVALRIHKSGLLQQLFPSPVESAA